MQISLSSNEPGNHFADSSFGMKAELLEKMMEKKITAISFENLKDDSDSYPIVRSMSEIAGSAVMLLRRNISVPPIMVKEFCLEEFLVFHQQRLLYLVRESSANCRPCCARARGLGKSFDNSVYRLKRLQNNIGQRMWTSVMNRVSCPNN